MIEWTFDPLEIKNAYLNIERLGAIARRYSVNQYGITSSPLQGGLPSDRLVAEWWLKSKRVESCFCQLAVGKPLDSRLAVRSEARLKTDFRAWRRNLRMESISVRQT